MIGYDIAAHSTVLWLEQYDKATYRVRYNNTPGSFGYQRVVRYNAARSTTTITFLSSIPLHKVPLLCVLSIYIKELAVLKNLQSQQGMDLHLKI